MSPQKNTDKKDVKKSKSKSQASVRSDKSTDFHRHPAELYIPPLDILTVKILNIQIKDEAPQLFSVQCSYFDQIIISGIIKSEGYKEAEEKPVILTGTFAYDPSDYEKMCLFADCPLKVNIQPTKSTESTNNLLINSTPSHKASTTASTKDDENSYENMSSCNIDILPLFLDLDEMKVKKRLEPAITPKILFRKSWCNLPLMTLEMIITRNEENKIHHKLLQNANHMQITLIGAYNLIIPYTSDCMYSAASKLPLYNENKTGLFVFNDGVERSVSFDNTSFYPKWENLRLGNDPFTNGDEKFVCDIKDIKNEHDIDLHYYFNNYNQSYTTIWGSFHRTLMLGHTNSWLWNELRKYNWPLEIHISQNKGGFSFMTALNLTGLLHPGETVVRLAVPLEWINVNKMRKKCGCDPLLAPYETPAVFFQRHSGSSGSLDDTRSGPRTGADDEHAFVLVEVKLARPLVEINLPPYIYRKELNEMLEEFDNTGPNKRFCSGRGQQVVDWRNTVKNAVTTLRRVPYHGMTDFATFYRQLSETRTRVEISTSCWQDAAIYVNNNFIVQTFLESEETFEEMLMMAHACLMRTVCKTVIGVEETLEQPLVRAARQARQMQDTMHAMDLYLQHITEIPRCPNTWRELATCLVDIDIDWANVCINKAVVLDPRAPLSLLAKGGMLFESNPEEAELFFDTLLSLYPFWATAWLIVYAYYTERQLYNLADKIMEYCTNKKSHGMTQAHDLGRPRSWGYELGDWWDHTPLLPGTSWFYDAADLLLRLRAVSLAEVCLALALAEEGESAVYYHLLALCCRLKGNTKDALCHLKTGIEKYGDISYLRSLEAECYHVEKNIKGTENSFGKTSSGLSSYSIMLSVPFWESVKARTLLVDLVRRQPSAYSWMGLADNWMTRAAMGEGGDAGTTDEKVTAIDCAVASAIQALKWDRRAGRPWALLSKLVSPSARRLFCRNMAIECGFEFLLDGKKVESKSASQQSLCHQLSKSLRGCRCELCTNLKL